MVMLSGAQGVRDVNAYIDVLFKSFYAGSCCADACAEHEHVCVIHKFE